MAVKLQQHSLLQLGKADRQIPAPVWLPVRVGSDAPAVDAGQFLAVTAGESQEVLEAQLRGRQLRGQNIKLPEGYQGVLCQMTSSSTCTDGSQGYSNSQGDGSQGGMDNGCGQQQAPVRSWDAVASFDSITYMNHDANPARADPQRRVLQDWLELAAKIHKPVTAEQVEEELRRMAAAKPIGATTA